MIVKPADRSNERAQPPVRLSDFEKSEDTRRDFDSVIGSQDIIIKSFVDYKNNEKLTKMR